MKKILSVFLALLMLITSLNLAQFSVFAATTDASTETSGKTITVYFINNKNWDYVNIYSWSPAPADWPGVPMEYVGVDASGFDIYSAEIAAESEGVIFNTSDGSVQTVDIMTDITNNAGWYLDDLDSYETKYACKYFTYNGPSDNSYLDESDIPVIEEPITVYFLNSCNWNPVYIYTWEPEPAQWPGQFMNFVQELEDGNKLYSAKISARTMGIVFSNGTSGIQTVDITENIADGVVWVPVDTTEGIVNVETTTINNFYKTEGDYVYSVLNDNTVAVNKYIGTDDEVEIPVEINGMAVSVIGSNAFAGNAAVKSVVIPETVTEIGKQAFLDCKALSNIALPSSLEHIASAAFENCLSLKSISIPSVLSDTECLDSNGKYCSPFVNCSYLTSVAFLEGVSAIPAGFLMDTNVSQVTISESVKSIGNSAFYNCENITFIDLPDSLTSIGTRAFEGCWRLNLSALPKNLETLGYFAFKDCMGITSMFVPKSLKTVEIDENNYYAPFYGCNNLKEARFEEGSTEIANHIFESTEYLESVYIPDTVTKINHASFNGCHALKSIDIPDGVTYIGSRTFRHCYNLKEIKLPSKLETIGYYAFLGCSGITSITIPKTFTEVYLGDEYIYSVFDSCTKLTEVVFEDGIKAIPDHICENMPALTKVVIPDSVTSIGVSAFHNSPNLSSVTIPENVESIGTSAFRYCKGITSLNLPEKLENLGERAFEYCTGLETVVFNGSPDVVSPDVFAHCNAMKIYCPKYSRVTVINIDNGNFCISNNDKRTEPCKVIDETASSYTISSGTNVTANVKYSIREDVYPSVTDMFIKIHIPESTEIIEDLLYLDKDILENYTLTDNCITIPVTNQSGKLSLGFDIVSDPKLLTYATLNYTINEVSNYEIIDIINENFDLVTLYTEDVVSSEKVKVSGVAPAGCDVDIYVDSYKIATFKANKAGLYSGEITLHNPENEDVYIISAKILKNGKYETASKEIEYIKNAPKLTGFEMNYNGGTYDLMSENKQNVTFRLEEFHGVTPFNFKVKFENREQIDKVYISSTRNQVTKTVEAKWSTVDGAYVFDGYFDDKDHDYVPGAITVNYSLKDKPFFFDDEVDFASKKYVNSVSDPIKSVIEGNPADSIENLRNDENQLSGIIKLEEANTRLDFDISKDTIPSYITPDNAIDYGYQPITDDSGSTLYMKVEENCEDTLKGFVIDFAKDEITDYLIEGSYLKAASVADAVFAFSDALGYVDTLITWNNNRNSIKDLKHAIMVSDMSEAEKNVALKKMDIATMANNGTVAIMAVSVILTVAGVSLTFPASMILSMLSLSSTLIVEGALDEYSYLTSGLYSSQRFRLAWNIDPSGYIYSGVTDNRISGATVTAYWIPFDDEDPDFWDKPDETKAIVWDSAEYSQLNPLTTDNDGNYSWDVPEGWWQVKCEKEGFETNYSQWLPVPPPQMDVHLDMVPKAIPEIDNIQLNDQNVAISFSQYMDPKSVSSITITDISGKNVDYTLEYSKDETALDGTVFAKEFTLNFEHNTEIALVTISDTVKNYAGKSVTAHNEIFAEIQYLLGDVDEDGIITVKDATLIRKAIASLETLGAVANLSADTNRDGIVNVKDATRIHKLVAKIIPEL